MTYAIGLQCGGFEIGTRLVRWGRTNIIAINRIAEKQKKVRVLPADHVEHRVAAGSLAASFLTAEVSAPGEGDRCRNGRIRKSGKFALGRKARNKLR